MADDIDIKEDGVIRSAVVKTIFPDAGVVKHEISTTDDQNIPRIENTYSKSTIRKRIEELLKSPKREPNNDPIPQTNLRKRVESFLRSPKREEPNEVPHPPSIRSRIENLLKSPKREVIEVSEDEDIDFSCLNEEIDLGTSIVDDGKEIKIAGLGNSLPITNIPVLTNNESNVSNDKLQFVNNRIILGSKKDLKTKYGQKCFSSKVVLKDINRKVHSSKYFCAECKTLFLSNNSYDSHVNECHSVSETIQTINDDKLTPLVDKPYCELCNNPFSNLANLRKHYRNIHKVDPDSPIDTDKRNKNTKVFTNKSDTNKTKLQSVEPKSLEDKVISRPGPKRFKPNNSNNPDETNENQPRAPKVHKPNCTLCHNTFSSLFNLKKHYIHIHKVNPDSFTETDNSYKNTKTSTNKTKVHSVELKKKPKTSTNKTKVHSVELKDIENTQIIRPGPKRFKSNNPNSLETDISENHCTHCKKSFPDKETLITHLYDLLQKRFECEQCKQKFDSKVSLDKHIEFHRIQDSSKEAKVKVTRLSVAEIEDIILQSKKLRYESDDESIISDKSQSLSNDALHYSSASELNDKYESRSNNDLSYCSDKESVQENEPEPNKKKRDRDVDDKSEGVDDVNYNSDGCDGTLRYSSGNEGINNFESSSDESDQIPLSEFVKNKEDTENSVSKEEEVNKIAIVEESLVRCPLCSIYFNEQARVEEHMCVYHDEDLTEQLEIEQFNPKCKHCDNKFSNVKLYNKHVTASHTDLKIEKKIEEVKNTRKKSDHYIVRNQSLFTYHCKICNAYFDTVEESEKHKNDAHPNAESNPIKIINVIKANHRFIPLHATIKNPPVPKSVLFKCYSCDLHYCSTTPAIIHSTRCPGPRRNWKCPKCYRTFKPDTRELHEKQHIYSKDFVVYTISEKTRKTLIKQILSICPKCGVHFTERKFLSHYLECGRSPPDSYYCLVCDLLIDGHHKYLHIKAHETVKAKDFIIIEYEIPNNEYVPGLNESKTNSRKRDASNSDDQGEDMPLTKIRKTNTDESIISKCGIMQMIYCPTCECYIKTNKPGILAHFDKTCKDLPKSICQYCGLAMTKSTLRSHCKSHEDYNQFTIFNVAFYDIDFKQIDPPLPAFPKCNICLLNFECLDTRVKHDCKEPKFKTCTMCHCHFNEASYKIHMTFHEYPEHKRIVTMTEEAISKIKQLVSKTAHSRLFTLYRCVSCGLVLNQKDVHAHQNIRYDCVAMKHLYKTCNDCNLTVLFKEFENHAEKHSRNIRFTTENIRVVPFDRTTDIDDIAKPKDEENVIEPDSVVKTKYVYYRCKICELCLLGGERTASNHVCGKFNNLAWCSICRLYFFDKIMKKHRFEHSQYADMIRENISVIDFEPKYKNEFYINDKKRKRQVTYDSDSYESDTEDVKNILEIRFDTNEPTKNIDESAANVITNEPNINIDTNEDAVHAVKKEEITVFKCRKCLINLNQHTTSHNCDPSKEKEICKTCGYVFYASDLKSHNNKHNLNIEYYIKVVELEPLKESVGSECAEIYKCICDLNFLTLRGIFEHFELCGVKSKVSRQNCTKCDLLFTPKVLFNHLVTHHGKKRVNFKVTKLVTYTSEEKDEIYKCSQCELHFVVKEFLEEHLKSCSQPMTRQSGKKCPECKLFFFNKMIALHLSKHHIIRKLKIDDFFIKTLDPESNKEIEDQSERILVCKEEITIERTKVGIYETIDKEIDSNKTIEVKTGDEQKCLNVEKLIRAQNSNDTTNLQKSDDTVTHHNFSDMNEVICKQPLNKTNNDDHQPVSINELEGSSEINILSENEIDDSYNNTDNNAPQYDLTRVVTSSFVENTIASDGMLLDTAGQYKFTDKFVATINVHNYENILFKCVKCDIHFISKRAFTKHVADKHFMTTDIKECKICHLKFPIVSLVRHDVVHHQHLKLKREDLKILENLKHYKEPKVAKTYKMSEGTIRKLNSNKYESNVLYKCVVCDIYYMMESSLTYHIRIEHKLDEELHTCNACNIKMTRITLYRHNYLHHEKNKLSFKDLIIRTEGDKDEKNLKEPVYEHFDVAPTRFEKELYKCTKCDVHFFRKCSLEAHFEENHQHKEPYKRCEVCNLLFPLKCIVRHRHLSHTKNNYTVEDFTIYTEDCLSNSNEATLFKCKMCNVHFTSKKLLLTVHIGLEHEEVNPANIVECFCGYTFLKKYINNHKFLHHRKKTYNFIVEEFDPDVIIGENLSNDDDITIKKHSDTAYSPYSNICPSKNADNVLNENYDIVLNKVTDATELIKNNLCENVNESLLTVAVNNDAIALNTYAIEQSNNESCENTKAGSSATNVTNIGKVITLNTATDSIDESYTNTSDSKNEGLSAVNNTNGTDATVLNTDAMEQSNNEICENTKAGSSATNVTNIGKVITLNTATDSIDESYTKTSDSKNEGLSAVNNTNGTDTTILNTDAMEQSNNEICENTKAVSSATNVTNIGKAITLNTTTDSIDESNTKTSDNENEVLSNVASKDPIIDTFDQSNDESVDATNGEENDVLNTVSEKSPVTTQNLVILKLKNLQ